MQSAPAPWPVPPSSPEAASPVRLWPELLRTAHLVYPEPTRHNKLNRLKYLLRGLLLAPSSLALLEILAAPKLRPLLAARPRVYSRLQWPYLDVRFRTESKLAALRAHHTFLLSTFPDSLLTAISSPEG
ncbi:MAG: hypothetical protein RLZZ142_883, partial [Verrucomicrobiota bacterium]